MAGHVLNVSSCHTGLSLIDGGRHGQLRLSPFRQGLGKFPVFVGGGPLRRTLHNCRTRWMRISRFFPRTLSIGQNFRLTCGFFDKYKATTRGKSRFCSFQCSVSAAGVRSNPAGLSCSGIPPIIAVGACPRRRARLADSLQGYRNTFPAPGFCLSANRAQPRNWLH